MKKTWKQHLQQSICTLDEFQRRFPQAPIDATACQTFPMRITPYYLGLIRTFDFSDPIYAQCVPQSAELKTPHWLTEDPLAEHAQQPVPGLIQRYPDRVLLITTGQCAVRCRHCMRKRLTKREMNAADHRVQERWIAYLHAHPEIRDVLVSGGDPLLLPEKNLFALLCAIRTVPSVEIIRIATRIPVTLPMRITKTLAQRLAAFSPLYINTHFNHPVEVTPEAAHALKLLADAGLPLGNQTVLLKGINDAPETIETLCRLLLKHRVRPYYLFQCDLVEGTEHFRTPLETGLGIMSYLRGRLSGLGIPHFALDTPENGKIELVPNAILSRTSKSTLLRTSNNKTIHYPEPAP
jgi:lysine 2,3-aminomutase